MKVVIFFGDSLTYGKGDDKLLGGYVGRITSYFEKKHMDWCFYNLGIPFGETTQDVLNRIENETVARLKQGQELIIIFAIGLNDTKLINNKRKINSEKYLKNIHKLINLSKKHTSFISFIGLLPVKEEKVIKLFGNKSYDNKTIKKYDDLLRKTCELKNIKYIKPLKVQAEIDQYIQYIKNDGIHPNSSGYDLLSKNIQKTLF